MDEKGKAICMCPRDLLLFIVTPHIKCLNPRPFKNRCNDPVPLSAASQVTEEITHSGLDLVKTESEARATTLK